MERVLDRPVDETAPVPEQGGRRAATARRVVTALRPLLWAGAVGVVVLLTHVASLAAASHPYSGRTQYGLHSAPIVVAVAAVAAVWWARRTGRTWDSDLLPALFGGLGALTLLTGLHGTPYDVLGLTGDQTFRTEAVTRFADTWRLDDYMYEGLPAYYAPAYFWTLGRVAAVTGTEPWHMLKFGTIVVAFIAPIVTYVLWRRIVSPRTAALISATPLIVPWLTESYAVIVVVAFIPWWLQVGFGLTRRGLRLWHPAVLGAIGTVLFLTYYYFFFIIPFAMLLHVVVGRRGGWHRWRDTGRTAVILGIAALGSAVYWAPLAWSLLTAPHVESLNNRWITLNSGALALPMLEPSVLGALCLTGLVYLIVTIREELSRALLIFLVSLYVWHVAGFLFLAVDKPLMSFRMRELVPVLLLAAFAIAAARVATYAARRFDPALVGRLVVTAGALLAVFAGDRFVYDVLDSVQTAHNQTLPDGRLPPFHQADAKASTVLPGPVGRVIDTTYVGPDHPVVLTYRAELMAIHPYYGFVQFNANYSHPVSQFHPRIAFIEQLGRSASPAEFAALIDNNPYDRIDVIVLGQMDEKTLKFQYYADDFPFGSNMRQIPIPKDLVHPDYFTITKVGGDLVAVRRGR